MLGGPKFIYRVDAQDKICLNVENDTYYDKLCTKITFLGRPGNACNYKECTCTTTFARQRIQALPVPQPTQNQDRRENDDFLTTS